MQRRTIAQRDLRNDVARVLREAEAGTEFTVTVRGRPVARVMPLHDAPVPRTDVDRDALRRALASTPVDDDWLGEELAAAEMPLDDPWPPA